MLHFHCFRKLYLNLHEFFRCFYCFRRQSDNVSALSTGETLLKSLLFISVALKNSRDDRKERFLRCFYVSRGRVTRFLYY
ncbi:hypothetical protein E2C01_044741 [Portunus trituberculatus]|uniref:Uncharacterized protein n=1 Tax=Portunus trituberculatus TaxID=210409 RepID=A0A5B7G004_PORTR|nr:hypothetical protein [Portunus trituberculatus]MPC50908.1 hypothetical protein [Portunus trituberculatus]